MGLFDMFKQDPAAAPTQPQSQQQQPAPGVAQPKLGEQAPTGGAPDPSKQADTSKPASPLDKFDKLWEPNDTKGAPPKDDKYFNIDPAKLKDAVKGLNFTADIPQELRTRIKAGGDDAAEAYMEAMNHVQQAAFTQSITLSTKLIEQALGKAGSRVDDSIKRHLRSNDVSSALRGSNPALNHPAARPIIDGIKQQLIDKNPTATPEEISQMASEYLENFTSLVKGNKVDDEGSGGKNKNADQDFSNFLNLT